ncbi:hypothetical protein EPUS_03113 [Endocarpon pusillum Z07020]|uniref:Uncharacterized protein n=1 Tax=Endocarpon pusillum (strain Z07020 / HMAS-L-300199) TaxID=1263415 RepID=U1GMZ1_ENDPU|nr:uncharacterized protein EPUS_03113 [Endocarpon pusillum Z07020]ERF73281.1 hypothetical protein EPUS_03113 [Endocarpon pusillum Z07020]
MAPTSEALSNNGQPTEADLLNLHKDDLSAQSLDLKDHHVSASLGLFIIHNVVRRNLLACFENAQQVNASNIGAFGTYVNYTMFVLEDQLDATDTIWFPTFAKYNSRFGQQIAAHKALKPKIQELKLLLHPRKSL